MGGLGDWVRIITRTVLRMVSKASPPQPPPGAQTHVVVSEEPGWRGVALPLLLMITPNAAVASLALGTMWALWHLPMFFVKGVCIT